MSAAQTLYPSRYKDALGRAISNCMVFLQHNNCEIQLEASWLQFYVDHWCLNKEVLVLLTKQNLYIIRYNWINHNVKKCRQIPLTQIKLLQRGDIIKKQMKIPIIGKTLDDIFIKCPTVSKNCKLVKECKQCNQGFRIHIGNNETSNTIEQNINEIEHWNPFSKKIPYLTFKSHIVYEDIPKMCVEQNESFVIKDIYSVDNFYETLTKVLQKQNQQLNNTEVPQIVKNIEFNNMTGIVDLIYNNNQLGSCRRRGNFIW
tara:strand:+ start:567 stop:1340 length:774 start_codon:yes stop_codon:yes gene_type:complete